MELSLFSQIKFNEDGLIPVIAQQYDTGEVLMLAWMNKESLQLTMKEKRLCYWSRSRQELWWKGDTSGHTQTLKSLILDCDGDTLLAKVDQTGVACHTGRPNCFFYAINDDESITITDHPKET